MESDIKKICFPVILLITIVTNILCSDFLSEIDVNLNLSVTWDVESTVIGYASFDLIGVVGCAKICFQKPECQSFTHLRPTLKCEIFDRGLKPNKLRTLKESIYSEKIDWNQGLFSDCSELNCSLGSSCFTKEEATTCIPTECGPTPLVANGQLTVDETRVGTLAQYTCDPGTVLEGRPDRRCLTTGDWQPDLFKCHLQCPPAPVVPDAALDDPLRIVGIYTNYTCVNNTVLFGTSQLYCQEDQTWTPVGFECIRQCPPAPDVNDATKNTTVRILNTTLGYQCHPRADTFGTPFIVCQEDLSWSPLVFNCSRQCPIAEEVTHARKLTHVRQVFTTLEYECINDTLLEGNAERFCTDDQLWEPIQFRCLEQCPVLDIPHAINDTSNRVLTSVVNYHCEDGYLHNGTTEITCQNDTNWTPINFECIEVCPTEAPPVQYAQTDQTLRFVRTVASYTCDPDTIIHGDNFVTCIQSSNSTILQWSTVPFWCEKVCPDPPPVVIDGTVSTYNRSLGALAEYICDIETVLMDGPATITCLQSQQWASQTFECRRQCPIPPEYPNSIANPGPRTLGETVTYNCTAGHMLKSGTLSIDCKNDQEWTVGDFDCFPICVDSPPKVPDGVLTNTDRFVGDVAIYSCVNDTVLKNGPAQVECQSDQTWASPTFDCRRKCPLPPSLDNGESIEGPRTLGETITYKCNNLFVMEGTPEIFCMSNQTWTEITFYCRPICPDPPEVADSSIISFNTSIGGTAEYLCDTETVLIGQPVLTCLSSQTWSTVHFECRRQCAVPNALPKTHKIIVTARTIGTILNYTCIDEHDVYPLTETSQIVCQQDQQWLIPFQCKPVCVESPPTVPDGVLTNTDRFVGDEAIYSCVNDTVLMNGPAQVECQSNQAWASPTFDCRRQCPLPPSLDNGESIEVPRTLGETITYKCNNLFVMEGKPEIFCMSNQTWTEITFYCRPICPDPPAVADSSILSFNTSINGTSEYQCDNETVLIGGPTVLTCLSSQTWSPIQFECRRQCAVPNALPNTHAITVTARTIGTILNYTCIDEHDVYPLTETSQIVCQQDQQWLIPFQCKPVCVESPPPVPDGVLTNTDRFVGDVAIYSCVNDTVLMIGPAQVECQSDQTWASPTFDCRRQCPLPPSLDNGESIPGPRTLGETITYKCNSLFVMEGTPEIFCMSNQTWTEITFYCRPICPDPPEVADSSILSFNTSINGTTEYQCDNETVLIGGPTVLTCLSSQTWSPIQFECRRQCAVPNVIPNTNNITITARTIGTILNYTCIDEHDVYPLTETSQIVCQQDQQWLIPFQCKPVCIESPPPVLDTNLTNTDRFVGDVAIYSCVNDTVLMNGPAQVECQSNQTWSSPTFDCRRQCTEPPTVEHTEPVTTDLTIGTIYNYTCITGHQPTSIPQITCQDNQQWSVVQFECRPVCEEAPSLPDTNLTNTDRFVGDVAIYSCVNDTVLKNGPAQVECQSNQTWSSPTFDCRRQCAEPPTVEHTETVTTDLTIGTIYNYTCITGHQPTSIPQITCQDNQQWSVVQFECRPVCEEVPSLPNTNLTNTDRFVGDVAIYSCVNDTVLMNGPAQVECQSNQTWSSPTFDCRRQCAEPPTVEHTESVTTDLTIGTIYNYTCITGHQPTSIPQITCQDNQQWSVVQFECRPVCEEAPNLPNTNLTNTDRFVGDVAIYSCVNDTVLMNGPAQVECQSNQTWSSPTFDCRRQCSEPPNVTHTYPVTGPRVFGSIIDFNCTTGYRATSNSSITCQQDGHWSQILFECQPVCEEPPTVQNTTASYNDTFVSSNVTFECDSGLTLSGNPTITCQLNTTWSSIDFSCN